MMHLLRCFVLTNVFLLPSSVAHAAEVEVDTGTTAWMLTSTALVLLMIPGLAMFYVGLVRTKNVLGTMMHSFAAMAIIGVLHNLDDKPIAGTQCGISAKGAVPFGLDGFDALKAQRVFEQCRGLGPVVAVHLKMKNIAHGGAIFRYDSEEKRALSVSFFATVQR